MKEFFVSQRLEKSSASRAQAEDGGGLATIT